MIVLLTDFGQSEYVGVMKAVICRIHPDARIIDLCHEISPQKIIEASWLLKSSFKYFPEGSVFCCVVDPGVGTARKALAIKTTDYYFVAPDNGLLWETIKEQLVIEISEIPIPEDASKTFHGRDVFAKAAASIDSGRFDTAGTKTDGLEKLEIYLNGRVGTIVRIDRFGNIITNLPSDGKDSYAIRIGEENFQLNFYQSYQTAREDELFLIEGSCSTLEISLKNGSANERLQLDSATRIEIS